VSFRFHRDNIILLFVITLYFSPLLCCTYVHLNIVLPSVIILYFPSWLIFYAKLQGVVYFPKLSFHTSQNMYLVLHCYVCLYFSTVFQEIFCKTMVIYYRVLFWFHRHNIVLPSITMLYFPLSQYYTSPRYHIVFFYHELFLCTIYEGLYTPLNWVSVLLVLAVLYFWLSQYCTSC
jgi:hypothetical protein